MERFCLGEDPVFHAIVARDSGQAVGVASLMRIDPANGVIEVGAAPRDGMLEAWVENEGPSIAFSDLEHVFDTFWTRRTRGSGLGLAPVIPVGAVGPEPLCAYYPRSVLQIIERQLDAGEPRLSRLVSSLPSAVLVSPNDVDIFGPPEVLFANINTAADVEAAARMARERALDGQEAVGAEAEQTVATVRQMADVRDSPLETYGEF